MIFRPQYQPTHVLIVELAAKYLRTPHRDGTAADADRQMEGAGRRLVNCRVNLADVETIVRWKSPRRMDRFRLFNKRDAKHRTQVRIALGL